MQQPRQRELRDGDQAEAGDANEFLRGGVIGFEELAAGVGIPGQEGDAAALAVVERFFVAAVGETSSDSGR